MRKKLIGNALVKYLAGLVLVGLLLFATVLLFLSIPLVLGSFIGFAVMLPYPVLLTMRIRNEEKVLKEGLPGYAEYCEKVHWRLIPFIW